MVHLRARRDLLQWVHVYFDQIPVRKRAVRTNILQALSKSVIPLVIDELQISVVT